MYRRTAVLGGVIGGAVGAVIWAAITWLTSMEIGWIAWGVGLLVGLGVLVGNGRETSHAAGIMAAVLAAAAVAGGKYVAVQLIIPSTSDIVTEATAQLDDTEYVISYIADDVVAEYEATARLVNWPGGSAPENPMREIDYPSDIWTEAVARWEAMSAQGRDEFRATLRSNIEESVAAFRESAARAGFLGSFGPLDLVFFGLAIFTAFKVASGQAREQSA